MKPSALKCLRLLEENELVTTHDFLEAGCGSRFGARIAELRAAGYLIHEKSLRGEVRGSSYELVATPEIREHMPESPKVVPVRLVGGLSEIPRKPTLWVATSDRGEWCGHFHKWSSRAAACARSNERYFRLRYGERQNWFISQMKVPVEKHLPLNDRAAA